MPDAFDSLYPTPVATSDAAVSSGKTNVVRFSERVRDWLTSLTPAAAAAYDSGWVACALEAGWSGPARVRRIGRVVFLGGVIASPSLGANATTTAATIPAAYRPLTTVGMGAIWSSGEIGWGNVQATGAIVVRKPTAGASSLQLTGITWLLD